MNGNRIRPSRRDSAGGQSSSSSKRRSQKITSRKSNDRFVGDEDEELPTSTLRGSSSLHIDTAQATKKSPSSRRKPKHASSAMKNVLQSKLSKSKSSRGQGAPSYAQERRSNNNMNDESISTKSTSRNSRNSRNKQRSATTSRGGNTKSTSNQQHSSPTDGRIDIIIGGHTNTSTKIQNTPTTIPLLHHQVPIQVYNNKALPLHSHHEITPLEHKQIYKLDVVIQSKLYKLLTVKTILNVTYHI